MPTFLQLPRELRDLIYEHYFRVEGSYVHDFTSNKLKQVDGNPIQVSLAFTCPQIAIETQGLALRINPLHFATFHFDAIQEQAALFHAVSHSVLGRNKALFYETTPVLLDSDMEQLVKKSYPQIEPLMEQWRSQRDELFFSTSD
jgi:hypothetical protein